MAKNRKYHPKKRSNTLAIVIIVAVVFGGGWLIFRGGGSTEAVEIISRNGLHWHPEIRIRIHGEETVIPPNIGIGAVHAPIHTHDSDNIIHLEFSGIVGDSNLRIGEFFHIWGKEFSQTCIFDNCNGPDGTLRMLVNGEPNLEFDRYVMKDGDRIEIIYE